MSEENIQFIQNEKLTLQGEPEQSLSDTNTTKIKWVEAWNQWYFGIEPADHPSYGAGDYGKRPIDYNQGRYPPLFPSEAQGKVYFFAGAAGTDLVTRSVIPYGTWKCILVPVYTMSASIHEFPTFEKSPEQLKKLVTADVDGVNPGDANTIIATLDGKKIAADKIQRVGALDFFTVHLPDENILDLDEQSTEMICDGWWLFLDPSQKELGAGDHILKVKAQSSNYTTSTTYNLCLRGVK